MLKNLFYSCKVYFLGYFLNLCVEAYQNKKQAPAGRYVYRTRLKVIKTSPVRAACTQNCLSTLIPLRSGQVLLPLLFHIFIETPLQLASTYWREFLPNFCEKHSSNQKTVINKARYLQTKALSVIILSNFWVIQILRNY